MSWGAEEKWVGNEIAQYDAEIGIAPAPSLGAECQQLVDTPLTAPSGWQCGLDYAQFADAHARDCAALMQAPTVRCRADHSGVKNAGAVVKASKSNQARWRNPLARSHDRSEHC